jgi:hypothetical protein
MNVVFTYLPIRLKEITEIYLKFTISNLNNQNIVPFIYSDVDYFKETNLKYNWVELDVNKKYKTNILWSYPKLKVLSEISFPFIHLDNDLIVKDINKLQNIIDGNKLNLCYKHSLTEEQIQSFNEIYKKYSTEPLSFNELNNTSIIATNDYKRINETYKYVLDILDRNYDYFKIKYNNIPPITLNQQYLNLYFSDINYLFNHNPSFGDMEINGVCHMADKNMVSFFTKTTTLI